MLLFSEEAHFPEQMLTDDSSNFHQNQQGVGFVNFAAFNFIFVFRLVLIALLTVPHQRNGVVPLDQLILKYDLPDVVNSRNANAQHLKKNYFRYCIRPHQSRHIPAGDMQHLRQLF
eukprot:gb/GECG01012090.1/.p1 GENE.gb/GECG01012090.1/~~gb/GECG01012090.1/.p1  ORF type:complete len:116 (+),score=12.36 gb/GECG01012090.1/:1-348(+)